MIVKKASSELEKFLARKAFSKKAETSGAAALSIGDLIYDMARIDPTYVKGAQFSRPNSDIDTKFKIGKQNIFTRQKSPKVYSMNTVAYVAKTSFILRKRSILEGKIGIQEIQDKFCLDIDTKHDVEIMQLLQ